MRKTIVIIPLLFTLTMSGQFGFHNIYLAKPDTNILYANFSNVIEIINCCDSLTESKFVYNKDTTNINGYNKYVYIFPNKQDSVLKIFKNHKLVYFKNYKIISAPTWPIARIGNNKDSILSIDQIITDPKIIVELPNPIIKEIYIASEYTSTYFSSSGDTLGFFENSGPFLNKSEIATIKIATSGDFIIFNIIAKGRDLRMLSLEPLKIIIK